MESLIKIFLLNVLGAALGAFFGALVVQLGTFITSKFKPKYKNAYLATFLGYLSSYAVGFILGIIFTSMGIGVSSGVLVFFLLAGFIAQAAVYSLMIKGPNGETLNFGKACLISLIQVIVGVALLLLIALIFKAINVKF